MVFGGWWRVTRNETRRVRRKLGSLRGGGGGKKKEHKTRARISSPSIIFHRISCNRRRRRRHFLSAGNAPLAPRLRPKQAWKISSAIRFIADRKSWSKTLGYESAAYPGERGGRTKNIRMWKLRDRDCGGREQIENSFIYEIDPWDKTKTWIFDF